ncbi:hypothetical protein RJ639_047317 [Escallonia herrerae]|uniref:Enoyl-CoA hydratase n=1 Tax=Escallonia herrerae TaxID=1293975 RepID=A0AA89AGG2_9ASTE|nr:hypothetical protein RJ639_022303 [Escallonia herrerae]KAK3021070.1 hypothetical protein RJ639_047317 [Escallonia herrerae]
MKGSTVLEVGADGVGVIAIINPPLNLLTYDGIDDNEVVKLTWQVDWTGANGKFSAGFDVTAFGGSQERKGAPPHTSPDLSSPLTWDNVLAARKPLAAAIDGPAFGGGLEIALACHARVATSNAQLGLPELQYGIIPGLGGTQRCPRLVGLPKALEMMLMSKRVSGKVAQSLCLVDAIAPADGLLSTARCWALDILQCRKPWIVSLYKTDKLEPLAEARMILTLARIQMRKQAPNLTHPLVCIDVVEEGIVSGPRSALWKEAEALHELRQSYTCRSLVHFFFAKNGTSKIPGISDTGLQPRKVCKIAILGGGPMGSGIARVFILSNYRVILKEVNKNCLLAGIGRIKSNLQSHVNKGKMTQEKLKTSLSLLKGVLDYDCFTDVDLVIESHLRPVHVMPFLKIVRTRRTSLQVIVDLLDVGKKIKKTSIVVGNCTALQSAGCSSLTQTPMLLVEHGADLYQIDQAITNFGMPMGPFRMVDLVGFGVAIATGIQFLENFPDRTYKSNLISVMKEDKREGESTCKGFYMYDDKHNASPDPDIVKFVEKARTMSHVMVDTKLRNLSDGDIVEMIFFPVVNEACRILAEGVVVKASDLDIASVMSMGFPSYRGGILFWANSLGSRYICSKLEDWSKQYGKIFKPCAYLTECASKGTSLVTEMKQTTYPSSSSRM